MLYPEPLVSTFSIVGRDPHTGDIGIAVQSKFLSVGSVVSWVNASAGAVATQSWANTRFGPEGLRLLAEGLSAQAALDRLLAADKGAKYRQVGIVSRDGSSATFSGDDCLPWAGGKAGPNWAAQGNILTGPEVVDAMARVFLETEGDLAHRLCEALDAGQEAGGDSRGKQSAALYIAREGGGYGGLSDRYIDLRVDDHPEPIQELKRLLGLWRLYFEKPKAEDLLPLQGALLDEVRSHLSRLGYLKEGVPLPEAMRAWVGVENFEERYVSPDQIDRQILEHLRRTL